MKLFLTSSTITPNLVAPFENLIGRSIMNLKCAFIVDAMYKPGLNSAQDTIQWIADDITIFKNDFKWEVDVIRLEKEVPTDFSKYNVIFMNGGSSSFLISIIRKTGFEKTLKQLITQGIPYVGSSAGSMILSALQDASSWYIGEEEPEAVGLLGLGYIDFQIYPHYDPEQLLEIKSKINPKLDYYLMKDSSAISIQDNQLELHGDIVKVEKSI